jgi:integrase/recombinase XerD
MGEHLDDALLWAPNDPLFPSTKVDAGPERQFKSVGLSRDHWRTAGPIREVFRKAFERAGLPYFGPHSFRKALTQLGERLCQSPEAFKAWSQNLGHEGVLTTLTSYGAVSAAPKSRAEALSELNRAAAQLASLSGEV